MLHCLDEFVAQDLRGHARAADTSRAATLVSLAVDTARIWRVQRASKLLQEEQRRVWGGRSSKKQEWRLRRTRPACLLSRNRSATCRDQGNPLR